MIPKNLHYIWLGGLNADRRDRVKTADLAWRGILPDYDFHFWTEDRMECILDRQPPWAVEYYRRALKARRFASAGNVARLMVVHAIGGVYVDLDVQILQPFPLEGHHGFIGFQRADTRQDCLNTAVMGGTVGGPLTNGLLAAFDENSPVDDQIWAACSMPTKLFYAAGLRELNATQKIGDVTVYDKSHFHPFRWDEEHSVLDDFVKPHTVTIHWWEASWK